jgi:predicted transposase YbfD/YdcC
LASKATKAAFSSEPNTCWPSRVFPPQGQWEKEHGRFDRRRLARVAVTPEEIGLTGCWQVIAVERYSQKHHQPKASVSLEVGCYVTSLAADERNEAELMNAIRGHWSGSENGTHYRRDVTFGEDACRTASRKGAAVLASLRNLAIGIFELQRDRKQTTADSLRSWCQQQTFTTLWPILKR